MLDPVLMAEESSTPAKPRFDGTINLGNVLVLIGMAATLTVALVRSNDAAHKAGADLDSLRAVVREQSVELRSVAKEQGAELRSEVRNSLADIRSEVGKVQTQVSSLPEISARLSSAERALTSSEARDASQDTVINQLRETAIQNRAEIEGLKRASGVNLPGAPGIRPR